MITVIGKVPDLKLLNKEMKKSLNLEIGKALVLTGNEAKRILRSQLEADNSNASKKLSNSISFEISSQFERLDNAFVKLSMEDYGEAVDQGRRAGKQPPQEAIEQWIIDKGIITDNIRQTAFLIARAIGEYGIPGTNFIEDSLPEMQDFFERAIDGAIDRFATSNSK